jgi:sRNA-binding regulator protein Hfq
MTKNNGLCTQLPKLRKVYFAAGDKLSANIEQVSRLAEENPSISKKRSKKIQKLRKIYFAAGDKLSANIEQVSRLAVQAPINPHTQKNRPGK